MDNLNSWDNVVQISKSVRVGTFIVTPLGRHFHQDVTCKEVRFARDLTEVDVVMRNLKYYGAGLNRDGRRDAMTPCSTCEPLTSTPFKVVPLSVRDVPCLGYSDDWVRPIRNRSVTKLEPEQIECLSCPVVDECFERFQVEQPEFGIMGGVTMLQYKAWGASALDMVRRLVAGEDTQKDESA